MKKKYWLYEDATFRYVNEHFPMSPLCCLSVGVHFELVRGASVIFTTTLSPRSEVLHLSSEERAEWTNSVFLSIFVIATSTILYLSGADYQKHIPWKWALNFALLDVLWIAKIKTFFYLKSTLLSSKDVEVSPFSPAE